MISQLVLDRKMKKEEQEKELARIKAAKAGDILYVSRASVDDTWIETLIYNSKINCQELVAGYVVYYKKEA